MEIREQGPPQNHNLVEIRLFPHNPVQEDFSELLKENILSKIDTIEK